MPLIAPHLFVLLLRDHGGCDAPRGPGDFRRRGRPGGVSDPQPALPRSSTLCAPRLPFLFIYNPALILYGIDLGNARGCCMALNVFVVGPFAMFLFAAATQGYFLARSRGFGNPAHCCWVAFTLFVPNFWLDLVHSAVRGPARHRPRRGAHWRRRRRPHRLVGGAGPDFTTGDMRQTTWCWDVDERHRRSGSMATGLFPDARW